MRVEQGQRCSLGMTLVLSLPLTGLLLGGCAEQKTVVITNPSPAGPTHAPGSIQTPAKPSVPASIPPRPPHEAAPLVPPPTPPGPTPEPIQPQPPLLVVPQTVQQEAQRGVEACEARILNTEQTLLLLDQTRLNGAQQDLFLTIQSFLAKAKLALSHKDLLRANTLADKAQTLADELTQSGP